MAKKRSTASSFFTDEQLQQIIDALIRNGFAQQVANHLLTTTENKDSPIVGEEQTRISVGNPVRVTRNQGISELTRQLQGVARQIKITSREGE